MFLQRTFAVCFLFFSTYLHAKHDAVIEHGGFYSPTNPPRESNTEILTKAFHNLYNQHIDFFTTQKEFATQNYHFNLHTIKQAKGSGAKIFFIKVSDKNSKFLGEFVVKTIFEHEALGFPEYDLKMAEAPFREIEMTDFMSTSPYSIDFYGAFYRDGIYYLAIEKGESDLSEKLSTCPLTDTEKKVFISSIAQGLAKIHEAGRTHGDLKADNIFIASDGTLRLGDYGETMSRNDPNYQQERAGDFERIVSLIFYIKHGCKNLFDLNKALSTLDTRNPLDAMLKEIVEKGPVDDMVMNLFLDRLLASVENS